MARPERYGWSEGVGSRPRVLIEHSDLGVGFTAQRVLEAEGFAVAVCAGPDRRRPCPLVRGRPCTLAAQADVVVHALNPDRPEHETVLRALREHRPDVPIVLELPRSVRDRHRALLNGCTVLDFPMTRASLVKAVRAGARTTHRDVARFDTGPVTIPWLVKDSDVIDCAHCGGSHVVFTLDGEPRLQVVRCASGTWPVGVENRGIPLGRDPESRARGNDTSGRSSR